MKRLAIYRRVSTIDQHPENQINEISRMVENIPDSKVIAEYVDYASGKNSERVGYQEIIKLARMRRIDAIIVWKVSRFGRSMKEIISRVFEMDELGVSLISATEPFDTSTTTGKMLVSLLSYVTEIENEQKSEAVKAGMERARISGKQIGAKCIPDDQIKEIRMLHESNTSIAEIGRRLKISRNTIRKYIRNRNSEIS